jgi:energy-coupling factor transporter ATP-binding protein EcfA2
MYIGIDRPDGSAPLFQDYGRYAKLLSKTEEELFSDLRSPSGRDSRTPSLVSFVGQTGAGKSTIIKLLIDLSSDDDEQYLTPVVGASGVDTPTSEDVHLYSDPSTAMSDAPMFFADCEGLQGGEREPLGAKFRRTRRKEKRKEHAIQPSSERELAWADSIPSSSREFAVTNLYPRLLYTFSDTIVFVLKNPRQVDLDSTKINF